MLRSAAPRSVKRSLRCICASRSTSIRDNGPAPLSASPTEFRASLLPLAMSPLYLALYRSANKVQPNLAIVKEGIDPIPRPFGQRKLDALCPLLLTSHFRWVCGYIFFSQFAPFRVYVLTRYHIHDIFSIISTTGDLK